MPLPFGLSTNLNPARFAQIFVHVMARHIIGKIIFVRLLLLPAVAVRYDVEGWIEDAEAAKVSARAWVETTLQKVLQGDSDAMEGMTRWFNNPAKAKKKLDPMYVQGEVAKVLQGILSVFEDMDFFPSFSHSRCSGGTVAYVDEGDAMVMDTFKMHICPQKFETLTQHRQVETFIHEASHHHPAGTIDVEFDFLVKGERTTGPAYSLKKCLLLAKSVPTGALQNAESYNRFVRYMRCKDQPDEEGCTEYLADP
mmetsp:Transcript_16657/g.32573  ORF Transcript_16657/g.32573 Transcript_16657/m.32573 type:complete len:253 (-) Transcript_16657:58-816(-)